ncbi:MAG: D-alanyl-D-alanine carboxypeptidase family protein [Alphaproteobacteria bacterium]|nr:D-alanyl-D-alanine carboxypeptidase family protein [Alphaproteobacteria bacterium]
MLRLYAAVTAAVLSLCAPAQAADCIVAPAPGHASLTALPDSYWQNVGAWSDMAAAERDLLVRVAIAQRNLRSKGEQGPFHSFVPKKLATVPGFKGKSFVPKGAPQLARMVEELRGYLKVADPDGMVDLGDTFRSYEVQLANWPANLKGYFRQYRGQLKPEAATGRYTDNDVCNFRKFAANRFAFPGYSRHQAGNAVDLRTRVGKGGPELAASTSPAKLGKTGKSNTRLWCVSPAYVWLTANARRYGFVQAPIDEPWHWEYDPAAVTDPRRANFIAPSCRVLEAEDDAPAKPAKKRRKKRS